MRQSGDLKGYNQPSWNFHREEVILGLWLKRWEIVQQVEGFRRNGDRNQSRSCFEEWDNYWKKAQRELSGIIGKF